MKQIILSENEARALVFAIKFGTIPNYLEKTIFDLIERIEKELES